MLPETKYLKIKIQNEEDEKKKKNEIANMKIANRNTCP